MAIINCPECDREISNEAPVCPHCGVVIEGNVRTCPDCGKTVLRKANRCPNCKCELTPMESEPQGGGKPAKPRSTGGATKAGIVLPIVALVLIIAGVGIYKLYSDFRERQQMEAAYAELESCYEAETYQAFLTRYPTSPYKDDVRERLEQLWAIDNEWAAIQTDLTKEALEVFLSRHQESKYTKTCTYLIDSLDWEAAAAVNTTESYRQYVKEHNDGEFLSKALTAIENLENPIVTQEDRTQVQELLRKYFEALYKGDETELKGIVSEKMLEESLDLIRTSGDSLLFTLGSYISLRKIPAPEVGNIYNAKFLVTLHGEAGSTLYSAEANISMGLEMQMLKMKRYVPTVEAEQDSTVAEPEAGETGLEVSNE